MPLRLLTHKAGRVNSDMLGKLAQTLPSIVASALHVEENPDAHLSADHIAVRVQESGPFDVNVVDLSIIVWAHDYPERLANRDERRQKIVDEVHEFLADYDRNLSGSVWLLLQPGSYGEI